MQDLAPYMRIMLVQYSYRYVLAASFWSTEMFDWTNKRYGPGNILKKRVIFFVYCSVNGMVDFGDDEPQFFRRYCDVFTINLLPGHVSRADDATQPFRHESH